MSKIMIEDICNENSMGAVRDIFRHKGIAIAAVGSLACVRSLYFIAQEMGRTDFLFWKSLSERDYSLGRNGRAIYTCIQEAVSYPEVKGVIAYASCMDILTGCDIDRIIAAVDNPGHVPIGVLYRGPLAKRRDPPLQALKKIWDIWDPEEMESPLQIKGRKKCSPPGKPDFEKIILQYASPDRDILLLTPGGCKSCIRGRQNVKNTRFTDISLSTLTKEKLAETILDAFPGDRPLILIETMAIKMVGLDMDGSCRLLRAKGKNAGYFHVL